MVQIILLVALICCFIMSALVLWQAVNLGSNIFLVMFKYDTYATLGLVAVALIFVMLLCCGVFICFCHKGYWGICVGCFSFFSFLWWVAFIVLGAGLIYAYTFIKGVLTDSCESDTSSLKDIVKLFDDIYEEASTYYG